MRCTHVASRRPLCLDKAVQWYRRIWQPRARMLRIVRAQECSVRLSATIRTRHTEVLPSLSEDSDVFLRHYFHLLASPPSVLFPESYTSIFHVVYQGCVYPLSCATLGTCLALLINSSFKDPWPQRCRKNVALLSYLNCNRRLGSVRFLS
jgi:hypothetical protein